MKDNIGLLLKKRAAISTHFEAFVEVERQRRFTFAQLNQRSNRIANTLVAQGVKPGDRVATLLKNGIEFAATYFIMLLVLFFTGAGRYLSVDYWIDRRFRRDSNNGDLIHSREQ